MNYELVAMRSKLFHQFWRIYNPPGLNWEFAIPAPARHIGSPHGVADCKSEGYLAAGFQIQPNEISDIFLTISNISAQKASAMFHRRGNLDWKSSI